MNSESVADIQARLDAKKASTDQKKADIANMQREKNKEDKEALELQKKLKEAKRKSGEIDEPEAEDKPPAKRAKNDGHNKVCNLFLALLAGSLSSVSGSISPLFLLASLSFFLSLSLFFSFSNFSLHIGVFSHSPNTPNLAGFDSHQFDN